MTDHSSVDSEFDGYAEDYDTALTQGLSVSGEDRRYFARGRIAWLASCLRQLQEHPKSALEYGCGTGSASPFLCDLIGVEFIIGIDVSSVSLEVAKRTHGSERARFLQVDQYKPNEEIDLVFCNGVFHHIPLNQRDAAVNYILRSLRPGGLLAFWENNPWNPGARYVMSRIPFDRNAVTLSAGETRRLLQAGGFKILRTDFLFIFPRMLGWFRGIEPWVSKLPFGAQYEVLCRKPDLQ